ncbi:peptidoglycan-binding protein [Salmonirosea aquatica]|uniref:Peptidoglycan binding-like domain-containing protein n=1 Tax=Salmonirosea aquatica TaxID=2654236 RepID=A0A7C9BMF9_9BACT|nr:hypothetical protein [Cytophagaceae bacterium SJW1-29]
MSTKLEELLRGIFLSSLAGIMSQNPTSAEAPISIDEDGEGPSTNRETLFPARKFSERPKLTKPFILKRFDELVPLNLSHRSHRSHSSHRSHYSSSSSSTSSSSSSRSSQGSSRSTSSGPSSPVGSGSSSQVNSSALNQLLQPQPPGLTAAAPRVFSLGDRILRLGMTGMDVTELVNILLQKGYLESSDGQSYTQELQYSTVIQQAVQQFQKDNGLEPDGSVGPQTVSLLKSNP